MNLDEEKRICDERQERGYCYWGVCKHCGVLPFIKKLQTGEKEHSEEKKEEFRKVVEG